MVLVDINQKVKIVIITRFGINMKDKEWYDYRYIVHKTFGQSCVLNQTNKDFEWIICLDKEPPKDFMEKMKIDFKNHNNIHLLHINKNFIKEYRAYIENNILNQNTERLILIRKDDDDAIYTKTIENIYQYLQNNYINLHFINEENPNMSYVCEFREGWFWGDKIINLFINDKSIIDELYYSRQGNNEIKIYYKNNYIQSVGPQKIYGDINKQLELLKEKINKNKNKTFIPFAIINNNECGYQYRYENCINKLYLSKIPSGAIAIYSILPTKNKKITNFIDCMHDNRWGHTRMYKTKGILFNNFKTEPFWIFVRGLVNDSGESIKYAYLINKEYLILDDNIIKVFNININYLKQFNILNDKMNNRSITKFKYVVDKNIKMLKDNII
jgi:hypothetical protein